MSLITKPIHELDMSQIIMHAYDIGELINSSADIAAYLYWKQQKEQCEELALIQKEFDRKKQTFEECERFGHYHPDYHKALNEVNVIQEKLVRVEAYQKFIEAENRLDDLLFMISQLIAHSVSDTIKVPSNQVLAHSGGCSSGGSCSGKCG